MDSADKSQRDSIQSKKQELVRQEIWMAGIKLFIEEGFDDVTVDQIAAQAGVSRRTFFRYFSSKDDLMGSSVKTYGDAISEALRTAGDKLTAYDAAKLSVTHVLSTQLSPDFTERFMEIGKRSHAALRAQSLQLPAVEKQIANAFSTRAGRKGSSSIEDRIAASVTFLATKLCVETWVERKKPPVEKIVEEVFLKLSSFIAPATISSKRKAR
jgi:AcrR family transcriptional regulator